MPKWTKQFAPTQTITFLLFDQFSNFCLANTVEPLRAANAFAGRVLYQWTFASVDGSPVESSSKMRVDVDQDFDQAKGDLLVVMPSYGFLDHANPRVISSLQKGASRFDVLVGLDTGSWLLASAGLLDGYQSTIHWDVLDQYAERFPMLDVSTDRFIFDRTRITSGGASAAFDLIIQMIANRNGMALAVQVEGLFAGRTGMPSRTVTGPVAKAMAIMKHHIEDPLPIGVLAQMVGLSQKSLDRRFRSEFGTSPAAVYRTLRLNSAWKLVSDTQMQISEIATRIGYQNAAAMTRAFRKAFNTTPQDMRRA